ncbi:MAG: 2-isopropylmalate synthase, partial [Rhodobacteraceae bacterium]|nr:2-isopropylmalate synthase [Paracoccaceae bacterium]
TTLRDGEQSPGATMTHDEKLEIAELLDDMGVDIIEAGFPIASEGDFRAVSEIAKRSKNSIICGLARAHFGDIDRCWEAVRNSERPRIHTFIGTSPLHRAIPNLDQDQMAERIHETVTRARNLCDNIQWSPMDATRTEHDYLCRVIEIAIKAGATTINIPDTVGYTAPMESAELIKMLIERVPGADDVIFATHCHNDLGMATANALAAVAGGARQIECTINGLGERAGNTALEEVVMALKVAALRSKLEDLGYVLADNQLKDVFVRFKELADRKKEVYDEDLIALMRAGEDAENDHITLKSLRVVCGTGEPQTAEMTLVINGEELFTTATGDGPVDATFNAVKALYGHKARLQLYQVHAVTEGTDAQATVSVRMEEDGNIATGQSADTDTVVASAKAYLNALNRLYVRRGRLGEDQREVNWKDVS